MFTTASMTASATSAILSGPRAACAAIGNAITAAATIASAGLRTLKKMPAMGVGAPKGQDSPRQCPRPGLDARVSIVAERLGGRIGAETRLTASLVIPALARSAR